jgi:hypothetical protein
MVNTILYATGASGILFPVLFVSAIQKSFKERYGSPLVSFLKRVFDYK